MRYAEKYGGARGTKNGVTIGRIRVACWISKATYARAHAHAHASGHPFARAHTHTHAQTNVYYLLLFHDNNKSRTRLNVTSHVQYPFCYNRAGACLQRGTSYVFKHNSR